MTVTRKTRGRPAAGQAPASLDEILAASLRVFARDGFAGASVASVNRELGVSHNLIHQRFGSKEGLWFAVVDWIFERGREALLAPRPEIAELPALERFRLGIVRFVELQAEYPDVARLVTVEAAIEGPRLDYLVDKHIGPILLALGEPLTEYVDAGILTRDDLRSIHFLIASGGPAPFAMQPLARRLARSNPASKAAIRRHAHYTADTVVAGIEARIAAHRP